MSFSTRHLNGLENLMEIRQANLVYGTSYDEVASSEMRLSSGAYLERSRILLLASLALGK